MIEPDAKFLGSRMGLRNVPGTRAARERVTGPEPHELPN